MVISICMHAPIQLGIYGAPVIFFIIVIFSERVLHFTAGKLSCYSIRQNPLGNIDL